MNYWTKLSAEFAQQRNYLDELFKVYPIVPNERRSLPEGAETRIIEAYTSEDNEALIRSLLPLELFPIKDSYVAYLSKDKSAIARNPNTVNRIAGSIRDLGLDEVLNRCTEPKENNRQMGPAFKNWINKKTLGVPIYTDPDQFLKADHNCIYNSSDAAMKHFANQYLGFNREKGLDFLAKFNNKYILGEAKFLTDFGGHQNAQFADAISTIDSPIEGKVVKNDIIPVAILDGVLYIKSNNKMYRDITENETRLIMSALVLREFLYQV